ncbi:MAG: type II toxin-antitoxin system VapC family toxin [Gammaproteobacteria bacterium]|nr:type II toxin-antitoxin system VapC family toxin [Gammaproteobacteria bacterium]
MFLLDTNVVSELLRPSPDAGVETWVGDLQATDLYFSAIGEAELRYGVAILPTGRRQAALLSVIDAILREDFVNRILPFDSHAAREFADIAAARRAAGRTVAPSDCQIAAIARSRDMTVVTRNVRHFAHMDIEVVNPWTGN